MTSSKKFIEINYDENSSTIMNLDSAIVEEDTLGNIIISGSSGFLTSIDLRSIISVESCFEEYTIKLSNGTEIRFLNDLE